MVRASAFDEASLHAEGEGEAARAASPRDGALDESGATAEGQQSGADFESGAIADDAEVIDPRSEEFSGFVFKLQANLDPRHRDRLAYVRETDYVSAACAMVRRPTPRAVVYPSTPLPLPRLRRRCGGRPSCSRTCSTFTSRPATTKTPTSPSQCAPSGSACFTSRSHTFSTSLTRRTLVRWTR